MKTKIYPIINMCGTKQGQARVTINSVGNIVIEAITNGEFGGGLKFIPCLNYVHHGLVKG